MTSNEGSGGNSHGLPVLLVASKRGVVAYSDRLMLIA